MKTILITGGAGYVGSVLVPKLLNEGYAVIVYDTFWFGDHLPEHDDLKKIRADVRDTEQFAKACKVADLVLHLACISNDPSVELDESLSRTINYEAFEPLVLAAKAANVERFVYCSSSSVYGISDAPDVTEDHPLVPITLYNKYKGWCEPLLFKHQSDKFTCVTIRPSTVCGYSPRMRLDLAVNILTNLAVNKGIITVYGGKQMRPNLHIADMVEAYLCLIQAPADRIAGQTFNVGAQNLSIIDIARLVQNEMMHRYRRSVDIQIEPTFDERSYQINSDKIERSLGYRPRRTVVEAIRDVCGAFDNGLLPNPLDDNYYNVRKMRQVWKHLYKDAPPSAFDPTAGHLSEIDMHRMKPYT